MRSNEILACEESSVRRNEIRMFRIKSSAKMKSALRLMKSDFVGLKFADALRTTPCNE